MKKVLETGPMKENLEKTAGTDITIIEEPSYSRETYTILSI